MRKNFLRPLVGFLLVACAIVGGIYLNAPAQAGPVGGFPGPSCSNGCPDEVTATVSGFGSTCAYARAIAESKALVLANQFCTQANGLCTFRLEEHGSGCVAINGRYRVEGHGAFACDLC